jgi:heme exporter protein A
VAETAVFAPLSFEATDLTHRYARRVGLEPVTFAVTSPDLVAITGPNGSGKSTLMRILAGLLRPSGGRVTATREGAPWPPERRRLAVGFCSPDVALYDEMTVMENLRFAAIGRGLDGPDAAAGAALDRVQLAPRANDRVGALSSGWRQRARLAFALLGDPELLLLDEPGSHLDDEGRAMVESVATTAGRERLVIIATNDEREWTLAERRIDLTDRLGRSR